MDRQRPGQNTTELEYRLAWARTYLKIYGLIDNSSRGVWAIKSPTAEPPQVDPAAVKRFVREQTRKARKGEAVEQPPEGEHAENGDALSSRQPSWRETLLQTLQTMDPSAFERLAQRILRESGFIEVEVTGRSGDGGIDGHGIIRVAGLISFPVLFQCKRYAGSIGAGVVRDFRGAMVGRADKGLIISTGGFTREAKAEATRDGAPPIDLIDGELLIDKLRELALGVRTRTVEVVEVQTEWFASV